VERAPAVETERAKVKIHPVGLATPAGKTGHGVLDDHKIGSRDQQEDALKQPGIGEVLDRAIPAVDVGGLVDEQVAQRVGGRPCLEKRQDLPLEFFGSREQFTGHIQHGRRIDFPPRDLLPPEQLIHGLLDQSGLADLTASPEGVDTGLVEGQPVEEAGPVDQREHRQPPKSGVAVGEGLRSVSPVKVVNGKSAIHIWIIPIDQTLIAGLSDCRITGNVYDERT